MASTYGNDLRLEEIGDGEQSGTWGATTNTNLELIAEALSFGTEAITTNANTHTTTIADGATDPGRSLYLKYTGTLDSACTITIAPNSISKTWYIENGTSGSQSIIISQGSGANVTIKTGQTKIVYSDGAGSGAAMGEVGTLAVANLAVDTNATVSGNATVVGNIVVSGTVDGVDLQTLNNAVTANTAKTGITSGQASAITANTAKTGITSSQASAITANTSKTTNATHSGEVTGSGALTIASNVVDEANLKVSNGPTNGYVLSAQSGNTGGLTWAAAGGGSLVFIASSGAISNGTSTVAFSNQFDSSKYHHYKFMLKNVRPNSNYKKLQLQTSSNGGSSFLTGTADYQGNGNVQSAGFFVVFNYVGQTHGASGEYTLFQPLDSGNRTVGTGIGVASQVSDNWYSWSSSINGNYWAREANTADNAVRFLWESGAFSGGEIQLYGIAKS